MNPDNCGNQRVPLRRMVGAPPGVAMSVWSKGRSALYIAYPLRKAGSLIDLYGPWIDWWRLLEEDQRRRQAEIDGLRGEIERGRRSGKPKPATEIT